MGFGCGRRVWLSLSGLVYVGRSLWLGFWFLVGLARVFLVSSFHVLGGLRVGIIFSSFWGIVLFCPIRQFFLVFLGPWVASTAFWGLRSSEPRGWLFVCFSCVFGYSMVT